MFAEARLLPAAGAFPQPGQDIRGTAWQQLMRSGEIALFCFDAISAQPVTVKGEAPTTPISEYCTAFRSLYMARLVARGHVRTNPRMICALYDKTGRWLATVSREGQRRRNPGLGLAWLLLQLPLLSFLGTVLILAASVLSTRWFGTDPLRWEDMNPQELKGLFFAGFLVAATVRVGFELLRRRMVLRYILPALQPVDSPEREKFYQRLAKTNNSSLLVPLDITFTPTTIDWPSPEKYAAWTEVLRREEFEQLGPYLIPEAGVSIDFWFNSELEMNAAIANHPKAGMWLNVYTRYEDASSFGASNKNAPPVDPRPTKVTQYLGPDATAEAVIERARLGRPGGVRHRPSRDKFLSDYAAGWREDVEWRRARGTSAEEYKRVDQAKAKAKAAGTSWL